MRILAVLACLAGTSLALTAATEDSRLKASTDVVNDIMGSTSPDKGIPQDLLSKANCVVVIPNLKKGAFVVGGQYGKGFATCRRPDNTGWTDPAAFRLAGGSVGFQIGGADTDLILLVMNQKGMNSLLKNKITFGADAQATAGPVGRAAMANTDAYLNAQMLAYSRSKGAFAGISLNGASLSPDKRANEKLYGTNVTARDLLTAAATPTLTADGREFIAAMDKYSPHEVGQPIRAARKHRNKKNKKNEQTPQPGSPQH